MSAKVTFWDKALRWFNEMQAQLSSNPVLLTRTRSRQDGPSVDILVVDVSYSMDETDYPPSRLDGAKEAAEHFIDRRVETGVPSLMGVVSFWGVANVVSSPRDVTGNAEYLKRSIRGLKTGPCTNISAGLTVANNEIVRLPAASSPRILLLTDGHPTDGPSPVETARKVKDNGIQLDIIGIGGSPKEVNERQLKKMASVVSGERRYWFIRSVGELVRKFEALALREID